MPTLSPRLLPLALPDRPSIAVLPFRVANGDPEAQAFADGLAEHVAYALACTPGLFVSSSSSAFTFRHGRVDPVEVGRALGVEHVLECTLEGAPTDPNGLAPGLVGALPSAPERVALAVRLGTTGFRTEEPARPLWSERLEGSEGDAMSLVVLRSRLVERTIATIAPEVMVPGHTPAGVARTRFPADFGIYAQFLSAYASFASVSRESIRPLMATLDGIARALPDQSLPLALKAQCFTFLVAQGWSRDASADAAQGVRLARAALTLPGAGESPATLMLVGNTLAFLEQDYDAALAHLDRSRALNPNSAAAYERSGWVRCYVGNASIAEEHFRAARRQSPLDRDTFLYESGLGLALCMQGEHEEAVHWLRRALRDKPSWTSSYRVLAASLAHLGRQAEAEAVVRDLLTIEPSYRIARAEQLYRDSAGKTVFVAGMRQAGVPE